MNPNTIFHFAGLAYSQNMSPFEPDDEPMPVELPLRLAAALIRAVGSLPTTLAKRGKEKQFVSTPTLERAVN